MRTETSEFASVVPAPLQQRLAALARWENEGGALEHGTPASPPNLDGPPLTNTELVQLRVRVIALENLVMALLAEGTDARRHLAQEMVDYILPRPGHTPHRLTIHAANRMVQLVERAGVVPSTANDVPLPSDPSSA